MRIGNNMDMPVSEQVQAARTANYSKADIISNSIRLDITDIGKDTGLIIDQGRSMQDVIDEAGALDVKTQTDYMVVMSNTMSEEDYAKMCRDGFKPGEMNPEESVTILDHIKAVMAQSGEVVEGYNDDLDISKLEQITGSRADANALLSAMKQADIPVNETNAKKINDAARNIAEVSDISDSAIRFMLVQNQQPTIENVYMASFSAQGSGTEQARGYYSLGMQGYLAKKADASDISSIMPDIQKTVEGFELENIDEETGIKEATWLVERGLDITKANIEKLDELMSIKLPKDYKQACERAAFSLGRGDEPKKADLIKDTQNLYDKAASIIEKTEKISDEQVKETLNAGKILNLKNLWSAKETFGVTSNISAEISAKTVTDGQAVLEEVRLKMTLDANVAMLKRGIEIDTLPLSRLVEEIRSAQQNIDDILVSKEASGKNSTLIEQGAQVYRTTLKAVNDIPYLPAAVIGRLKIEQEYSLTTVHEVGTDMKARYEAAGQSYETLMTAPRRDMGDSISKAFRNVDDILNDLGIETDEANRKAVRILGYNSMEINEESISQIREATDRVMNAVNALTPAKTLELIRQGINPMQMSIDELTEVLSNLSPEEADEKYSRFLYKLDKSGEISDSEREAYIGIYRFINRLEKTDAAAIGALVNSEREITLKSLLSGMRSSKARFNETIDDSYGFLQDTVKKGISISDQIEQAFARSIGKEKDERLNEEYLKEDYREYMDAISLGKNAVDQLIENGDMVTVSNMAASEALASVDRNAFRQLKGYAERTEDKEKEESVKEDYDNALTDLIDRFEDRDSAKKAYASVIELGKQIVEDVRYSADNSIDLRQISLCHKQLSLALSRSDRENYTVPVNINGETTAINLTLRHDKDARGEVNIGFETDMFGRVTVQFNVSSDGIKGLFVSQNREGVDVLKRVSENMSQKLEAPTDFRVIVGLENRTFASQNDKNQTENADINNMDTKTLYGLAKEFLKTFVSQM